MSRVEQVMTRWVRVGVAVAALASVLLFIVSILATADPPKTTYVTSAAYGAGQAPQQPPDPLADVRASLRDIQAKLDRLLKLAEEEPAAPPPAGNGQPPEAVVSAATKCAQCHDAANAAKKGAGFAMFTPEDQFANLTAYQREKILKRVGTSDPSFQMPPPKSGILLSETERAALAAVFSDPPKKEE